MESTVLKWIYLLKANYDLLKLKTDKSVSLWVLSDYESYFLDKSGWVNTLKEHIWFKSEDPENNTQKKYYKKAWDVPWLWIIRTNIKNNNFSLIDSDIKFNDISQTSISWWIIHIEWLQWRDRKDILLFQSFNKAHMYVWKNFWKSKFSLRFQDGQNVFSKQDESNVFNLQKSIDAVFVDDEKLYVYSKIKYNIIFNFYEEFKIALPAIFKRDFQSKTSIFEYNSAEIPELIESIQENTMMLRKIYITIYNKRLDNFNIKKFEKHLSSQWLSTIQMNNGKIVLRKAGFWDLLDAINSNFYTGWDGVNYVSKEKRKR